MDVVETEQSRMHAARLYARKLRPFMPDALVWSTAVIGMNAMNLVITETATVHFILQRTAATESLQEE